MADERTLLDEINRSVGMLVERLEGVRVDVAESRSESKEHRQMVYEKLERHERRTTELEEEMIERLGKLETLAATTAAKVAKIEPTIEAFTRLQQRGIGAMAIVGLAATLIGGAIALKWDAFAAWLTGLWR